MSGLDSEILKAVLTIVPWVFTGLALIGSAFLGWKVGLPAVKILQLEQKIKVLELQFTTALDEAKVAESRARRLEEELKQVRDELHEANLRLAALLTVIELKKDLPSTALRAGEVETVVRKVEKT